MSGIAATAVDTIRDAAAAVLGDRAAPHVLAASAAAAAATVAIVFATSTVRRTLSASGSANPLPPSPPSWPLVGHLPLLASTNEPDKLIQRLARDYGPVFHLKLGNVVVVIISSQELAQETLIKRGKVYAGRWAGKVLTLNSEGGQDMAMRQYSPRWSHLRKVSHRILTPLKLTQMDVILDAESLRFVQHVVATAGEPVEIKRHLMLYTANIMLAKCLGISYDSPDDPALQELCHAVLDLFELGGVGGVEDYFDSRVLDWAVMRNKRKTIADIQARIHDGLILNRLVELKARLNEEAARGVDSHAERELCYAEELLLTMDQDELSMNEIKLLMMDFLFAGIDTTAATLLWLLVHVINDPTHQARLQAEAAAIIAAHGRLPSLDDFDSLPYTRAVIKEVTRLSPVAPLGLPRQTLEDDTLAGYHIPKGAQVIYNIVGIHDGVYDAEFRPDRWLDAKSSLGIMDGTTSFGAGRRLCPGVHLAAREMLVLVARLFACVGVENAKGGGVKIDMAATFGLTVLPKETVLVKATVRGPSVRDLVEKVEVASERVVDDRVAQSAE
ncbi:cytochrome P450 2 sub U member 1 [Allomyces javanicus]|nr:cytochrome P450 2 sub U member 1 [Allomyces javanicus]